MKEYTYTKTLGSIVGVLAIFLAIGFGILSFLGKGLSKALNTGSDYGIDDKWLGITFAFLLLFALITVVGVFFLKNKAWRVFYIGFCLLVGIGLVLTFFISFGAIGFKSEVFILCVGIVYLGLSYLTKSRK